MSIQNKHNLNGIAAMFQKIQSHVIELVSLITCILAFCVACTSMQNNPPLLPILNDEMPGPNGTLKLIPAPNDPIPIDGGRTNQALAAFGREDRIKDSMALTCDQAGTVVQEKDVAQLISERARGRQVVIINEEHHKPAHRAFIQTVVSELSAIGFTYYAAETLNHTRIQDGRQKAQKDSGYYIGEPQFGKLLNHIYALNMTPIGYESESQPTEGSSFLDGVNFREREQVANLIERLDLRSSGARVLIHVGGTHARETPQISERFSGTINWMGSLFHSELDIDPLTIDQRTFEHFGDEVKLCTDLPELTGNNVTGTDLHVSHPQPSFSNSRPVWRMKRGERLISVPDALKRPSMRSVIEVYSKGLEVENPVPIDMILIDPGEEIPMLLPSGDYIGRVWTNVDGWSSTVDIIGAH